MDETAKIAIFKGQKVRKAIHNNEWWFVVEDAILALIDSSDPKQYVNRMKLPSVIYPKRLKSALNC